MLSFLLGFGGSILAFTAPRKEKFRRRERRKRTIGKYTTSSAHGRSAGMRVRVDRGRRRRKEDCAPSRDSVFARLDPLPFLVRNDILTRRLNKHHKKMMASKCQQYLSDIFVLFLAKGSTWLVCFILKKFWKLLETHNIGFIKSCSSPSSSLPT